MFHKSILLLLITAYNYGEIMGTSTRLYFTSCGKMGFSCLAVDGKYNITYQCPKDTTGNDVTFYLWQFKSPTNTQSVTLRDCKTLRLSFQCTNENKQYLKSLAVINVTNLIIIPPNFAHNPPVVIFQNVTTENLPPYTFSQIKSKSYKPGCFNPPSDLTKIYFNNVDIGTISTNAFDNLNNFDLFHWLGVKVHRLQHQAVQLNFNKNGNFSIRKSRLEVMEHLAFQITATSAEVLENDLVEMQTSAFNGTMENFMFIMNTVDNLQSRGLSLSVQNINILDNKFQYLKSGAFEGITPGLLQNSLIKFKDLKFSYTFSNNFINYLDAGSLNPDILSFDNVPTELKFDHNSFYCTCDNLGWFVSKLGHGANTQALLDFYSTIVEEEFVNICSFTSCQLPLARIKYLVDGGQCVENISAESLCITTTTAGTIITPNYYHYENSSDTVDSLVDVSSGNEKPNKCVPFILFCTIFHIFIFKT